MSRLKSTFEKYGYTPVLRPHNIIPVTKKDIDGWLRLAAHRKTVSLPGIVSETALWSTWYVLELCTIYKKEESSYQHPICISVLAIKTQEKVGFVVEDRRVTCTLGDGTYILRPVVPPAVEIEPIGDSLEMCATFLRFWIDKLELFILTG